MADVEKTIENAYVQFSTWLNTQPYWLQDAAWRIYNGKKIEDDTIKSYAEMCIAQSQKRIPTYNHLSESDVSDRKEETVVSVISLSEINGVNALADNARLEFSEEGITAVYGLNGAGKSGFMRIFKQLSNNPYEEPIQPNVFKKSKETEPVCKVVIKENGDLKEATYKLASRQKESLLSVIDVFDTRISNKYVGSENNVSYEPFVFTVLSELAAIADKINSYVETQKAGITEVSISVPKDMLGYSSLEWVQSISGETVIPDELKLWTNDDQRRQDEVVQLLDTEKVKQQIEVIKGKIKALEPVVNDLRSAKEAYSLQNIQDGYALYCGAKKKLETAQKLFSDTADEQDKISIDSAAWKSLWSSAKAYYESVLYKDDGPHFAEPGSICPLCHQAIDDRIERFGNVNEYINGSCSTECKKAEEALKTIIKSITTRQQSLSMVKTALTGILTEDDTSKVFSLYENIGNINALGTIEDKYTALTGLDIGTAYAAVSKSKTDLEEAERNLKEALVVEKQEELEKELSALKARKWVFENQDAIQRVIGNHKRIAVLKDASQYLNTNRITTESNKLAEALITDAYIERFNNELKTMAPNIKVKLEKGKSRKGNTPYKVSIDTESGKSYRPEDILSEGEQRIVALAAFFADATGRDERTPIIIDDPISSLDINYEKKATSRIVELARVRQIIVFTHRISMLVGLQEEAKNQGVACEPRYIRSAKSGKGVPDLDSNYHGNLVSHLNELRNRISRNKKLDPDSEGYEDIKGGICQQFRTCIERSVETELLLGTVERFRRSIVTKDKVRKLSGITNEDCEIVERMMTKYSFTEHSQPIDSPPVEIGYDEIDDDVRVYVDWITDFRKRMR